MADIFVNRLSCTISNSPGVSGAFTAGPARSGFRTFGAQQNGKTFTVLVEEGAAWEVRNGCTYTHSTTTLSRGTLEDSSTGSAVSFSSAAVLTASPSANHLLAYTDSLRAKALDYGISSTASNCAPAFASLGEAILNASQGFGPVTEKVVIELPPGVFYVDGATLDLTYRGVSGGVTPNFTLRGSGKASTIIRSTADSTAPAVLQILAGYALSVNIEHLSIWARDDIQQDGLHVVATRRSIDNTGGITDWAFNHVGIRCLKGDACVMVGGEDYLAPNQHIALNMCSFRADTCSSLKAMGQFGQVTISNGDYDGARATSSAPSIAFAQDLRACLPALSANTTSNHVTLGGLDWPVGTPVRIVGTNLPTGLSTGVTYYTRTVSPTDGDFTRTSLHSSRANVVTDTRVSLGTTGTLGNWYVSAIYVSSVGANVMNFEFPHHLVDCGILQIVGSSLPTGLATATDYYVIRKSATQISLASSKTNALAGVALTFSGGNVNLWGMSTKGYSAGVSYSVNMQCVTSQNGILALYCSGARDVQANLHIENTRNAVYVYNSHLAINGGDFGNPADDGGKGIVLAIRNSNSRVTVSGLPCLGGVRDNLISTSFGAYYSGNDGWCHVGPSTTGVLSVGLAPSFAAAATLDTGPYPFVLVAGATTINSLSSKVPPTGQVKIMAYGSSLTFSRLGNLAFAGSTVTIPDGAVAVFERAEVDLGLPFVLVSKTA